MSNKKFLFSLLILAIAASGIFYLSYSFELVRVSGNSMSPTYQSGQIVFANKLDKNYAAGDVVTAKPTDWNLDGDICKRILAVPGDTVVVSGHDLYINNTKIDTGSYPNSFKGYPYRKHELKEDEYFLVGDNRTNSLDSRAKGPVKKADILSKVINP